jgi:hypothetical protein
MLTPRAGSPVTSRWRFGVVTLVHRYRRAGASALTILLRWCIGVVTLVHVGIAVLRLVIASMARHSMFFS